MSSRIPRRPLSPKEQKLQALKDRRVELKKQLISLTTDAIQAESLLKNIIDLSLKIDKFNLSERG